MKASARDRSLSCVACHGAHDFDTRAAAVDSCLGCHDDRHSRTFVGSPHYALWAREAAGDLPPGAGVSCATCHMPRTRTRMGGTDVVVVQHNQNDNLRPADKMIRSVCLECHGLRFAIDSLADPRLIASNFAGKPARSVAGIDMAMSRRKTESE